MRNGIILALMIVVVGCGPERDQTQHGADAAPGTGCTGIECQVVDCEKQGMPPTTLTGTVYAPNGTLALYGATVYVPHVDPGPFKEGVECSQCVEGLPGGAVTYGTSDTAGNFALSNAPSGTDIPLFITIGKWRRKVTIPSVTACQENPLPAALTSLPRNRSEGDLPRIAIATGSCDALECLLRKIGVGDSEFSTGMGTGNVHLYASNGANQLQNSSQPMLPAAMLWGDLERMKQYDMMLFSCECGPEPAQKPQPYMDNLKAYADIGGRVFLSHYHSIWIEGEKNNPSHAPAVWPDVATCNLEHIDGTATGIIDQVSNPKGTAFAQWMMNVQGSTSLGQVTITESRRSCSAIDPSKAERWVYLNNGGVDYPQNFQFTTPVEADKDDRCGKVVFSDMHVASGSSSSSFTPFPGGCAMGEMSPQEKALAFMLFDIATCVGPIL
jgi:hypothetical protein